MNAAEKLQSIVNNARGDDLERAKLAFRHLSNNELDEEHGQSGRTRRELLESYEAERQEWEAAKHLLDRLVPTADA